MQGATMAQRGRARRPGFVQAHGIVAGTCQKALISGLRVYSVVLSFQARSHPTVDTSFCDVGYKHFSYEDAQLKRNHTSNHHTCGVAKEVTIASRALSIFQEKH